MSKRVLPSPDGKRYGSRVIVGDFIDYIKGKTHDKKVRWICDCGNTGVSKYSSVQNSPNCIKCNTAVTNPKRGKQSKRWRGGRTQDVRGYIQLTMREHPYANSIGRVAEHRVVMEQILGRYLLPGENVHHKNGVKNDNRPENLELWSTAQPYGQRVEDKIDWAIELLRTYRPEILRDECSRVQDQPD